MISLRFIFLSFVLVSLYLTYVSPIIEMSSQMTSDNELRSILQSLASFEQYDKSSYNKGISHLKRFLSYWSESFTKNTCDVYKLKKHRTASLKYMRRIPLRLDNDYHSEITLVTNLSNLELVLDNYIFEATERCNSFYNGSVA
jgi:hypothetical protein